MTRRTALKCLHWAVLPLTLWFVLVQPRDVALIGSWAVQLHSVLGLIFVTLALIWWADYLRRGLASRPGPKLGPRARVVHQALHKTLVWGLFGVALSGFLLGVTASRQLWAGGIVPIGMPLSLPRANDWVGRVHAAEFYILAAIVAFHAGFHIWRHVRLRDNALRIMLPRFFYRFL
ncbi:cytochrome b/b6 domain-containing protein [Aestuariicoccus sp. MJ-SS9]|uniref:cytochrome b/b6 domain-containing protein n=1 Tax=Aestuariicoccus sp. MJ-SS9 TaxID=3079855 RepID=UPI0029106993|nr:cytochrome b/b6 domain-containing protein [Aestuariicoccus sp. MJ-SS9]MDU8911394.1 cytochrome b/b6 domain-containing protein [Aestuariicoccus sp. MJ-SS9]